MRKTKRMLAVVIAVMMIFTAFPMTANAATKNVYNFNVSNSKVTKNASDGKLPADANPVYVGGKYYFNLQVSNDIKLKIAELYIKYPGTNKFDKKHIENAKNFMRYAYASQSVGNKEGELTYYWKVMNTSGKWKSLAKKTVKVVKKPQKQKNVSSLNISVSGATYTGKGLTPEPVVKDGSKVLKKGTDYTTQYSNNVNAGTGKVVITGKGNYTGSVTRTFKINKANDSINCSFPEIGYSTKAQSKTVKVTLRCNLKLSAKSSHSKVKATVKGNYLTINVPAKFKGDFTITVSSVGNANVNGSSVSRKYSIVSQSSIEKNIAWPANNYYITTLNYYWNNGHPKSHGTKWGWSHAVDIGGGGNVLAAASGKVEFAGWDKKGLGNCIIIKHNDGNRSVYGHLKSISVKKGNTVKQGQVIGVMGNTGDADGVHLHFELEKGNPMDTFRNAAVSYKFKIGTNVYKANNAMRNKQPICKTTADWIKKNYEVKNGWYVHK